MYYFGGIKIISEKYMLIFEKNNSKYGRIWGQMTNLILFFMATFLAWVGFRYSLLNDMQNLEPSKIFLIISSYNEITAYYFFFLFILACAIGFLSVHLVRARDKIKMVFNKFKIDYD